MNVAGINATIISNYNNEIKIQRKKFLKQLALSLLKDNLQMRQENPKLPRNIRLNLRQHCDVKETLSTRTGTKRKSQQIQKRCEICPRNKDRKTKYTCYECDRFICMEHIIPACEKCVTNDSNNETDDKLKDRLKYNFDFL